MVAPRVIGHTFHTLIDRPPTSSQSMTRMSSRIDVLIHAKEIGRIVFFLDGSQACQVRTEGCLDDLFCFDVERGKQDARSARKAAVFPLPFGPSFDVCQSERDRSTAL